MSSRVYILGGAQTDFSRNWAREGLGIYDMFDEVAKQGLTSVQIDPVDIEVGHVGNFVSALFTGQAQLGGFFGHVDPAWASMPASRHEAACASGSMAIFAAMADIESGRYGSACVLGIELMRNVSGTDAAANLGAAAFADQEATETPFVWPCLFSKLVDEYNSRYGINHEYLAEISRINFANGKNNPNSQTRRWQFAENSFSQNDEANPPVIGRLRKHDCGQITDGAAVLFLAGEESAARYAKKRGIDLDTLPWIKGWGHRTAPMLMKTKLENSKHQPYIFPHISKTFSEALQRANFESIEEIDGLETHDCFNITEYMAIDHSGLTAPGESWQAIEDGTISMTGSLPINASGGLIGLGHPVGCTGVRMALDCFKQVTGTAGDYQIEGAQNMMTFNVGGSSTTSACLVIGR